MVLGLVSVTRMYAAEVPRTREEAWAAGSELLAFARIFERIAHRWGPWR